MNCSSHYTYEKSFPFYDFPIARFYIRDKSYDVVCFVLGCCNETLSKQSSLFVKRQVICNLIDVKSSIPVV